MAQKEDRTVAVPNIVTNLIFHESWCLLRFN